MNRRGFLLGLFASAAIVKAGSLMPVRSPPILLHGDGVANDAPAFKAMIDGKRVWDVVRRGWIEPGRNRVYIPPGDYLLTSEVLIDKPNRDIDFAGSHIDASRMPEGEAAFRINADFTTLRRARITGRGPMWPGPSFEPPLIRPEIAALVPGSPPAIRGTQLFRWAGRWPALEAAREGERGS